MSATADSRPEGLQVGALGSPAPSAEERAAWRTLAGQESISAPFVDEPWASSWREAFRPQHPLLLGVWEGDRLAGVAAVQRLSERWLCK
jgi:CelD/BcsL family acetyltransferase involved in cellulose biosynthesis